MPKDIITTMANHEEGWGGLMKTYENHVYTVQCAPSRHQQQLQIDAIYLSAQWVMFLGISRALLVSPSFSGMILAYSNRQITLLRVIPPMAFNSSHLTFCLANLLAFYLTFFLRFYLAYLLAFYLSYLLTFYLACLLAFYLAYLSGILSG